jgi:hypothetical protein
MKYISIILLFILIIFSINHVSAHTELPQPIGEYKVNISQDPLSPFVGEEIKVIFTLEDKNGSQVKSLKGTVKINKHAVEKYTSGDSESEVHEIYEQAIITDNNGKAVISYSFKEEGYYDVEFIWGKEESESVGRLISVREPTSYFLPSELINRIWLFVGIAFAGCIVGAMTTFFLLTLSFNRGK